MAVAEPRCPEARELAALVEREEKLASRVGELDAEQRAAGQAVAAASSALVQLEKAAALGQKVNETARQRAEDALLQARSAAAAPWLERRQAAAQAAADARRDVALYASANFSALLEELEEAAVRAAEAVDQAAQQLLGAVAERAHAAARVESLVQLTRGRTAYGDIAPARSDAAAQAAERLLAKGGEAAPLLRDELRPPGAVDVDPEPAEAVPA